MSDAIRIAGLTKRYGALTAVDNLNLTVARGELFALLGVNGAGKTTTIKMLAGLTRPTSGEVYLLGRSLADGGADLRRKVSLSPQETAVAPNLTVGENLVFIAEIYGLDGCRAAAAAAETAGRLGLDGVWKRRAKTLSGGMQRRLSLAMALITEPELLFLDEPTLGLDVLARRELWTAILALKGRVTIILTTHYMEEVTALSDRIGVLRGGRLLAVGTAAELTAAAGATTLEDAFVALAGEEGER